jgi:hypothetical protein
MSSYSDDINNVINYDDDWISDFIRLIYKCGNLSFGARDEEYASHFRNLRWQQIHGDREYDRDEIDNMIEFLRDAL